MEKLALPLVFGLVRSVAAPRFLPEPRGYHRFFNIYVCCPCISVASGAQSTKTSEGVKMELADIRREYTKGGLRRKDLKADP
ncbi:hypothetical protein R7Q12_25410, partial [Vibrio sp. 399]|nr:hypothetical protein [Vibrio sp. 399]